MPEGMTNRTIRTSDGASVTITLTVTNGLYTAGDAVGGLITIPNAVRVNGGTSILASLELNGVAALAYEIWFFNANIATPAADNAAFALAAADGLKHLGTVGITSGDYNACAGATFNAATLRNLAFVVQAAATTTTIYAYMKAVDVTSPATTTLYLTLNFVYVD